MGRFNDRHRLYLVVLALVLTTVLAGYLARTTHERGIAPENNRVESQERGEGGLEENGPITSIEQATIRVVERVGPAVVKIRTVEERIVQDFFFRRIQEAAGVGSGVIFDPRGHILTNNHVIQNAKEISVLLPGRERAYPAKIIGTDPFTDIAVVKIEGDSFPTAKLGDSDELKVGQFVVAIGNPFGFENSVTSGLVSALNRGLVVDPQTGLQIEGVIQTDASINPGNSGGPLLNLAGEVVGINTAIIQQAQGIGFAVPINTVKGIVEDILTHGKVIRLGVVGGTINASFARAYEEETGKPLPVEEGVFVLSIMEGSPAHRIGLRDGDIIIGVNEYRVRSMEELVKTIRQVGYGGDLEITYVRGGEPYEGKTKLQ